MPAYKSTEQYEAEARWIRGCLIHPVKQIARKLYLRRHGTLKEGIEVCHACDHPLCILDAHHFTGTHLDNLHDASVKGRFKKHSSRASKSLHSELATNQWANKEHRAALLAGMHKPEVKARMVYHAWHTWQTSEMRQMRSDQSKALWRTKKYAKNVSMALRKAAAAKSPEERSAIVRKSWATRRLAENQVKEEV